MEPIVRIMTIRLAEKIHQDEKYAVKLGVKDASHYKGDKKMTGGK